MLITIEGKTLSELGFDKDSQYLLQIIIEQSYNLAIDDVLSIKELSREKIKTLKKEEHYLKCAVK